MIIIYKKGESSTSGLLFKKYVLLEVSYFARNIYVERVTSGLRYIEYLIFIWNNTFWSWNSLDIQSTIHDYAPAIRQSFKRFQHFNFEADFLENIKSSYNNNKFKISARKWNDTLELPDGSYSISDIQDYFEYTLKKHGENIDNPLVKMYANKIENRISFKIKTGYFLELLIAETIKLLWSTENK